MRRKLARVLLRALNKNQLLILRHLDGGGVSMTRLLQRLSESFEVPLSTLKLNARILRELGLVEYGNGDARLTEFGRFVLEVCGLVGDGVDDS